MKNIDINKLDSYKKDLCVGEKVLLNGVIYTARDAAHARLTQIIENCGTLPFDLCGATIYYAGPTATPPGGIIGSCGPTTAGRMDKFTPLLLSKGLSGIIGKGERNQEVMQAMVDNSAIYFCAVGGAGALYANCVTSVEVIAFEELGCESIKRLTVKKFPVYVGIDCKGNSIYSK